MHYVIDVCIYVPLRYNILCDSLCSHLKRQAEKTYIERCAIEILSGKPSII
jgi:hypothetical protein